MHIAANIPDSSQRHRKDPCVQPARAAKLTRLAVALLTFISASVALAGETTAQHDARMAWWREAKFGMFIHWGVYSVPAGFYHGEPVHVGYYLGHPIPCAGEWIMNVGKIPMAEYQGYAKKFNPEKFDAEAWVKMAKDAGQKYIIITAKHHDGFAMFDTQASPWGITHASPFGRDPLKELAAACKKEGIQLGFYYSQAQDWNNGGSSMTGKWDPAQQHGMDDYIDKIAVPQVKELLTNYGQFPSVLWWDTPVDMNPERAKKLYDVVEQLRPGIIMNNRLGGGFNGDTETPEQFVPATGFPGRDWETCMTINDTWGYRSDDQNFKSTSTLIHNLCDIASKGGNYLLNVGPTSEGLIPQPEVDRLKEIGAWMKVNGEAIYGTTASPFESLPWGRCTKKIANDRKSTTLYLHVFDWPAKGILLVPGLRNSVQSARLLATGENLKFTPTANGVELTVPATAPDANSSTVVLEITGTPEIVAPAIAQDADGTVKLGASDAKLQGGLKYEAGDGRDDVGYWTNSADTASWLIQVDHSGKFKVSAEIAAVASGKFEVVADGQTVSGVAPVTADYSIFKSVDLTGSLQLSTGRATITVKPVAEGWSPMNLRSLQLVPMK
jgi:alpha-L-fucosidase